MQIIQRNFICIVILLIAPVLCENKYSKSANEKNSDKKKNDVDFRTLEKPFRMNKLNLLWSKAQHRLTEPKLKSLYSDLMIQDKEEITYKRVKSEGGDKEGLKEAELRRKLTTLMNNYGLREHFEDGAGRQKEHPAHNSAIDDHINRSIFKDKKLNQLWAKAEMSGFTSEELSALKEEFFHHQDKIDQYYELLTDVKDGKKDTYDNAINEEEMEKFNEINGDVDANEIKKDFSDKTNMIRDKHRHLRDGFDRLQRITARGPNNKEFIEPKVQGLWRMATAANFTVDELESLKSLFLMIRFLGLLRFLRLAERCLLQLSPLGDFVELQHYESRLLKLRALHADHVRNVEKLDKIAATGDKMDHFDEQQLMIKKHSRKVEKMHADLEGKILSRHSEL